MSSREGRRWWSTTRALGPVRVSELAQTVKTAGAGVLAWAIAVDVLHLQQPFLAPWAAVLVVHATVYRTLERGGQQVAATFLGVIVAWASGRVFGPGVVGMGVMLVASYAVGRLRWWREEATSVATTGIVVLATNAVAHDNLLLGRLVDSTVGVVVGLAVNLLVWPPLRDRAAWARADQLPRDLAGVLADMATALRPDLEPEDAEEWVTRLRRVDVHVDEAWSLLRSAEESSRFNVRRSRPVGLEELAAQLHLVEQAVADELSMARTIATSAENRTVWAAEFRSDWARLLQAVAEGVERDDVEALRHVDEELTDLVRRLSTDSLAGAAWHEYGGLLVNLRNVVHAFTGIVTGGTHAGPPARRVARYRVPGEELARRRRAEMGDRLSQIRGGYSRDDEH